MQSCGQRAVLVITQKVEGTSTNIARRRVDLSCGLGPGHPGRHRDLANDEEWDGKAGSVPTILRHEDEEKGQE